MADAPRPPRARTSSAEAPRRRKPLVEIESVARPQADLGTAVVEEVKRTWPGLLLSLGMHVLALCLLALVPILLERPPEARLIEFDWGTAVRREGPEPVRMTNPFRLSQSSPASAASTPVAPAPQPVAPGPGPVAVAPVSVANALGGRGGGRGTGGTGGGTGEAGGGQSSSAARQSLDRALQWIAKQQFEDGHWSLDGPYPDGATRTRWSTDVGATALALLAFLGDGHTHQAGEYTKQVGRGLDWLLKAQRPTGEIYDGVQEGEEPSTYSHAISTIVLCETIALTGDERFHDPATRAVEYLVAAQNPVHGGWGYRPLAETGEGDLSVTGWALMALHTARMAGIDVDPAAFFIASGFVDRCQESPADAAQYKYKPTYPPDPEQRLSMTASGLLARQWMGWPKDHAPLRSGVRLLLDEGLRPQWDNGRRNVYGWFYAAEVLHNMGGDDWRRWFAHVQQVLIDNQTKLGRDAGSWHPTRPAGSVHEWSGVVGRLYVTVMCVLILETPFRHAAIYEALPPSTF